MRVLGPLLVLVREKIEWFARPTAQCCCRCETARRVEKESGKLAEEGMDGASHSASRIEDGQTSLPPSKDREMLRVWKARPEDQFGAFR